MYLKVLLTYFTILCQNENSTDSSLSGKRPHSPTDNGTPPKRCRDLDVSIICCVFQNVCDYFLFLGETFLFAGLCYPPIWKIGISTKKKDFLDTTVRLLNFSIIRNHPRNYFETSLMFGKLCKNYNNWGRCLFCNRLSEIFQFM